MELVKVAGTAISIHQTILIKNSFPFPLTSALTIAPSISATRKLIRVLKTRKKLWLISSLVSLLRQLGTTILSSLSSDLKNSRSSATFFRGVSSLPDEVVPRRAALCSTSRADAAFCSDMALRTRWTRARKRVIQTAREIRLRFERYSFVKSDMIDRTLKSLGSLGRCSFDCEAMAVMRPALALGFEGRIGRKASVQAAA